MASSECGAPEEDAGASTFVPEAGDSVSNLTSVPSSSLLDTCRCVTNADGHHFLLCQEEENIDILRQSSSSFYPTHPEGVFVLHSPLLPSHLHGGAARASLSEAERNAGPRRVVAVSIPLAASKSEQEARELLKSRLPGWEAALRAFLSTAKETASASAASAAAEKHPQPEPSSVSASPSMEDRTGGVADLAPAGSTDASSSSPVAPGSASSSSSSAGALPGSSAPAHANEGWTGAAAATDSQHHGATAVQTEGRGSSLGDAATLLHAGAGLMVAKAEPRGEDESSAAECPSGVPNGPTKPESGAAASLGESAGSSSFLRAAAEAPSASSSSSSSSSWAAAGKPEKGGGASSDDAQASLGASSRSTAASAPANGAPQAKTPSQAAPVSAAAASHADRSAAATARGGPGSLPATSDKRGGVGASSVSSSPAAPPQRRPTLFNLLDALAHDSVTTPDQRNCIRSVVTDFLNHSLPHAKVYTFIGAIVGHDVLHAMVRKLEEQPSRLGAPDQGGLTRIEKAFGLTKTSGTGSAGGVAGAAAGRGGSSKADDEEKGHAKSAGATGQNDPGHYPHGARSGGRGHGGAAASAGVDQTAGANSLAQGAERDASALSALPRHAAGAVLQSQGAADGKDGRGLAFGGQHSREEVVKAMRRNLESRRQIQGSVDVFDRVKWLPVRRALTPVPAFGHSLVTFSNTAVLFGGSNTEGAISFRHVFVINTNDFSVRGFPMGGEPPCERDGHTTTGLTTASGPAVILFGGCSQDAFLNDVYMLEVDPKRWVRRHPVGKAPQPRDQHVAAVFPARTETGVCRENSQEVLSEFLFIFGGRIGSPEAYQATNDLWTFHLATDTWSQVLIEGSARLRPPPRFGCCGVWSNDVFLTLFGGETTSPLSASSAALAAEPAEREDEEESEDHEHLQQPRQLLDDLWHFKIIDVVGAGSGGTADRSGAHHARGAHVVGEWIQEKYEGTVAPRSHYAAIFITQRYQEPRAEPRTVERLMLVTSGLTYESDSHRANGANAVPRTKALAPEAGAKPRKVVETDQISVYFFSRKTWFTLKPRYPAEYVYDLYGARQRHVACFFEAQPLTQRSPRPPVPCLLIHGGFRGKQVLNDAWVLSLTGEDPYRGALFAPCNSTPHRVGGMNASGYFASHSLFFPGAGSAGGARSSSSLLQQQLNMGRTMLSLRMYPSYYIRETHSPGILWALCSQQRWVFGAISQLVENSLSPVVASRNVYVSWEETPEKEPMLSIQDDGQGVDYPAMNKLLRLYGAFEPGDRMRKSYEYGIGFKMAFGRLSSSCAVMSRTQGTIGVGMLSMELMGHCDAREIVAPMCMWRLPNKELINRDPNNAADHRHHQRLLMSYTPFTTPNLLAEQINLLGTVPGTRLVFWDLRDDLDFLLFDAEEGTLFLNSAPTASSCGDKKREKRPSNPFAAGAAAAPPAKDATEGDGVSRGEDGAQGKAAETQGSLAEAAKNGKKGRMDDLTRPRSEREEDVHASAVGGPELLDLDEEGKPLPSAEEEREPQVAKKEAAAGGAAEQSEKAVPTTSSAEGKDADAAAEEKPGRVGEKRSTCLKGGLPPVFPLWTCARHALDYCLPTYLFWFHLHAPALIHVQGLPLLPTPASLAKKKSLAAARPDEEAEKKNAGADGAEEARPAQDAREAANAAQGDAPRGGQDEAKAPADAEKEREEDRKKRELAKSEKQGAEEEQEESEELAETTGPGRSLYFFLKERLYCQAELQYLFTPADHATGCFALFGFLNDPTESPSLEKRDKPRVCEAGVLLYFRQRLVRRLDAAFPDYPRALDAAREPVDDSLFGGKDGRSSAEMFKYCLTAVVHVPEWMLPSMTKQDFLHEHNTPFMKFKSRLLKLIDEYLRRCRNPEALQAWLDDRARRLRDYHEELRRSRPKRRLGEDFTDEERPRRSPTPPAAHSSSGAPIWTGERGSGAGATGASPPPAKQRAVARSAAQAGGAWSEERGAEGDAGRKEERTAAAPEDVQMEEAAAPAGEPDEAGQAREGKGGETAPTEAASAAGASPAMDSGAVAAETGAAPAAIGAGAGDSVGAGTAAGAPEPSAVGSGVSEDATAGPSGDASQTKEDSVSSPLASEEEQGKGDGGAMESVEKDDGKVVA
ncbi:hypothetical protein BESB_017620 [Besnoitia besnoiti]|uniref:Corepressor complex CRC230 n=1 Tax=Besnoitia besnoiti TaxID=94643 RepID=A0A2A9M5G6_BESBE|nr:hypothetical protein BESB_017620 [Besnoitia besnoiti]PFH32444.1 hypothetical protein BESB_017620 [Besnoitia besnoiti]